MWFRSLIHALLASQQHSHGRKRSARSLFLEGLEKRNLLTAYSITELGSLGGNYTYGYDMNEASQVVGSSATAAGRSHAFLWNNGAMLDLGTLGGSTSYATAVNDLGQVVGYSWLPADQVEHAFLLTPQGGQWFQDSDSDGRNDFMTDLGAAADLASFKAMHSNDAGQVAGSDVFYDPAWGWTNHAVIREVDGTTTDLGPMPEGYDSFGEDINNAGQVIGSGWVDIGLDMLATRPFVWDAAGGMVRLPEISSGFQLYPYENEAPTAINDSGSILVNCYGAAYSAVRDRAFLLTPVPEGTPSISIADANTVIEGNSGTRPATFTVTLSAASDQIITITYATSDGNATAGSDYQAASGTLTIPAGQTTGTITVLANGDTTLEPNETFYINLTNASGATIADGQGVGTIVNDDVALPALTVSDVSKKEGNSGTTTFSFVVTLSAPSSVPVTVQYATANGTATVAGRDYTAKSGTLTFQAGQTSKTISISVRGDRTREAHETFFLNLANSQGATITDGQGIGTILNDDGATLAAVINELALSQTGRKRG